MGDIVKFPGNYDDDYQKMKKESNKKQVSNLQISKSFYSKCQERKNFSLKRFLIGMALVSGTFAALLVTDKDDKNEMSNGADNNVAVVSEIADSSEINTSVSELSQHNIVLVNDGLDSSQLSDLSDELINMGLEFSTGDFATLLQDKTETFISFMNWGGDEPVVIANYSDGNNHADLLALGMAVSFSDGEMEAGDLRKGVSVFENGITKRGPSDIESFVGDNLQPTVTIAVPYGYQIDSAFASKMLEGLARYNSYFVDGSFYDESYLYRVKLGDSYSSLPQSVIMANGIRSTTLLDQDEILLRRTLPSSFSVDTVVNIEKSGSKSIN